MASILFYILFFTVWIYALNRSISYSGIDTKINVQASIHWLQVLFWTAVGTILSGSTLMLLTDNLRYLNMIVLGTIFGWSIIAWIFFQTEWDERAMVYHKHQYMYLQLPRTTKSVLALEHFVSSKLDHVLYWGLVGTGIALGLVYEKALYPLALCSLSFATAVVILSCRLLRYAAVTQSELIIRYGTPPFRLLKINLKNLSKADPKVEKNRIRLTIEDNNNTFSLNLPPESNVARIVVSHLTES